MKKVIFCITALFIVAFGYWFTQHSDNACRAKLEKLGYDYSHSGFERALTDGSPRAVELFLKAGIDPDILLETDQRLDEEPMGTITPLEQAIQNCREEVAHTFIQNGQIVGKNSKGYTALHAAALYRHHQIAAMLIDKGMDVTQADHHGRTPLHYLYAWSAEDGKGMKNELEILKLLIAKGADVTARTGKGISVLQYAAENGSKESLAILMERMKKKPDLTSDNSGRTILHAAVLSHNVDNVNYMLNFPEIAGLVGEMTHDGMLPFHAALVKDTESDEDQESAVKIAQRLMKIKHVDVNTPIRDKVRPLHLAVFQNSRSMSEYLLKVGADPNVGDEDGDTPLHFAAQRCNGSIIRLLQKHGALMKANLAGELPLDKASECSDSITRVLAKRKGSKKGGVSL